MSRKILCLLIVLSILCVGAIAQEESTSNSQDGSIAATVNGEVITKQSLMSAAQLTQIFQTLIGQFPVFGQVLLQTEDGRTFLDSYQRNILDQMINSRLSVQLAKEHEIQVEEKTINEQVQDQLDQIKEQNQMTIEDISNALQQQGSSLEEYKTMLATNIREQLLVQGLREDITAQASVSEESIQSYYSENKDQFASEDATVSPLSEVTDQIYTSLLQQAQSNMWNEWFENAKAEADIEILF